MIPYPCDDINDYAVKESLVNGFPELAGTPNAPVSRGGPPRLGVTLRGAIAFAVTLLGSTVGCRSTHEADPPPAILATVDIAAEPQLPLQRYEYRQVHMGCEFKIVFFVDDPERAERARVATFARVDELDRVCSDYLPDSELMHLCRAAKVGAPHAVSHDLWQVLRRAQQFADWSSGAFDVTVGPLSQLWRRARHLGVPPRPRRIAVALDRVGYEHLHVDATHPWVTLAVPEMRIDLGAIAKGYALDAAAQVLLDHGIDRYLVDAGGDLRLGAPPPSSSGWKVQLGSLTAPLRFLLHDCAVATSGDDFQHLEAAGTRYSHILDPRTGDAITQRRHVTVVATDATLADALASALSVLGAEPLQSGELKLEFPGGNAEALVEVLIPTIDTPGNPASPASPGTHHRVELFRTARFPVGIP